MTPELYEEKRNQLISLMEEVLTMPGDMLSNDARKSLDGVMKKSRENQFQITLIGRYQGGKSTTFNALCEGMEISPRGNGIKTSAAVITAQNTIDPNEVGTATVVWRSKEELTSGFFYLISSALRQKRPDLFREQEGIEESHFDLDNAEHRADAQTCLDEIWGCWKTNKGGFSEDQLDALRIGSIILAFYTAQEIVALRNGSQPDFKIEDVGAMVRFPAQWERRWINADPRLFKPSEVCFAFIKEINCKIHSANLERIGCKITDCPGLFASPYDTKVAMEVLSQSDAVWYLLNGRQIAETDLRLIKSVLLCQADNVFFTLNMDQSKKNINDPQFGIVAVDIACLENNGISRKDEDIHRYHARLALCASIGKRILTKTFDTRSSEIFLASVKDSVDEEESIQTVEEAWENTVETDLGVLKVSSRKEITGLDEPSITIVRKESGLDEILGAVEQHVVSRKAKSILIDKGAALATITLEKVEGDLKAAADDARSTEEEFRNEYDKAENALKDFHKFYNEQNKWLKEGDEEGSAIDVELAKDFWRSISTDAISDIANNMGQKIYEKIKLIIHKDDVEKAAQIGFTDVVRAKTIHWQHSLQNGENSIYNENILARVKRTEEAASNKWAEIVMLAPRLEGIQVPNIGFSVSDLPIGVRNAFRDFSIWSMYFDLALVVKTLFRVLALVLNLPIFLQEAISEFREKVAQDDEQAKKNKISKISKEIAKALPTWFETTSEKVVNEISKDMSKYRKAWLDSYNTAFQKQRNVLEERRQNAEREHQQKLKERMAKADTYDEIRTKHIEPKRLKVQAFCKDVSAVL